MGSAGRRLCVCSMCRGSKSRRRVGRCSSFWHPQGHAVDVALQFSDEVFNGVPVAVEREPGEVFDRRRRHHRSNNDFSVASSDWRRVRCASRAPSICSSATGGACEGTSQLATVGPRLRTFEQFGDDLADGLSSTGPADAERSLLVEEVKIGCTLGMLQCLDRSHRVAYVLGEILDLTGPEAADALDISPELFRKRLQHARAAIESFTRTYCGLASDSAACACHRRVPAAVHVGRVRSDALDFAHKPTSYQETRNMIRQVERARWALEVHRTSHPKTPWIDFARRLAEGLGTKSD